MSTKAVSAKLSEIELCIRDIEARHLPSGGFAEHLHGSFRPDSTAWAVLALARKDPTSTFASSGRSILAANQLKDGRIAFPASQNAFWPTPIALLAWHGISQFNQAINRAVNFLFETSGNHTPKDPASIVAHDTSIKGWPWIEATHAFVHPTAITLLALETMGYSTHPRFQEGIGLLMNRQLPHGGWNYGNTLVYGKELRPFVETTGIALTALAGHVERDRVANSIRYLVERIETCRTPLSLVWALFGLGAWGQLPAAGLDCIEETLQKQTKYGSYGTSLLSMLLLAHLCRGDFRMV